MRQHLPRAFAALSLAAFAVASTPAEAANGTNGCADVNAGVFNETATTAFNRLGTISGFNVGDTITFTVTGNASGQSHFELINGALNTVLLSIPLDPTPNVGSYTVTGNNSDTTLSTFFVRNITGSTEITIVATCPSPTPPGAASQSYDRAVTKSFLLSRINGLLLNSPASTSILYRQLGPQSGVRDAQAVPQSAATPSNGVMGLGSDTAIGRGVSRFDDDTSATGTQPLQFRSSLSSMREAAREAQMQRDRMALGAGDGGALPLAFEGNPAWDIWVEGRYSGFDDDTASLGRDGHVGLLFLGGDYRITPDIIIGGLVQWDRSKETVDALTTEISGNGWMLGPYLSARVHEHLYVDLRAAWGRSSNDLTVGAASGGFDTTRWLVKGAVSGNWMWDGWRTTPSAELFYVEESQDAFTNSAGTFVPGQDVSLGRLQFGPEVGYRIAHDADTFIEPFAALKGVWDWDNPNAEIIDGFVAGPGDFWGRLEGGLNVLSLDGTIVRGLASWDGIGSDDYSGYTFQGIANVPLN